MWSFFKKYTKDKNLELEERLTQELIDENDKEIVEEMTNDEIYASVINYVPADDENQAASINVLVEQFHNKMMPEIGSIIWIPQDRGLRPFKTIRFDFIENGLEYDTMRVYIVVEPATISDIIPHPGFTMV